MRGPVGSAEKVLWCIAAIAIGAGCGATVAAIMGGDVAGSIAVGCASSLLFFVQPWKR